MTEPLVLVPPDGRLLAAARAFGVDAHAWDAAGGAPMSAARAAHLAQGGEVLFVADPRREREAHQRAQAVALELGSRTWVLSAEGPEELAELLEGGAQSALEQAVPVDPPSGPVRFTPFPCGALPPWCRAFVEEAAAAMDIDPAFVAVPLLGALAGAIGNSRRVRLKRFYTEPAVLWTVTVARSGSMKSPPLDLVLWPLREADREAIEETQREHAKFEEQLRDYERELSRHRRGESGEQLPEKPERPPRRAVVVDDIVTEALAVRLADNPRGLLMARAELSGWIHGMDAYRGGRGGDREKFLEMHGAKPLKVDRKTGDRPTIYVPRAALSIMGTIQPRVLAAVFDEAARGSGLAARLFMTRPPERPSRWTEDEIRPAVAESYRAVVRRLLGLQLDAEEGPLELTLTDAALRVWISYHDASEARRGDCDDEDLCAAISKLRGGAARLALVVALARAAERDAAGALREVGLQDMEAGIQLATWFAGEADRIYSELSGTETKREGNQRRLVEWIEKRGGAVVVRDLRRSLAEFRGPGGTERAQKELEALAAAGVGRWEHGRIGPKGGRPTRIFVLEPPPATAATRRDTDATTDRAAAGAGSVADLAFAPGTSGGSVTKPARAEGTCGAGSAGGCDETQAPDCPGDGFGSVAAPALLEESFEC